MKFGTHIYIFTERWTDDSLSILDTTRELGLDCLEIAVGDKLWGVHACENDRGVPGGGLVPWESVFQALLDIGFDGYVLMESYDSSIGDFAHQHRMFHDVCSNGPDFVRRGLAFLKHGLHQTDAVAPAPPLPGGM